MKHFLAELVLLNTMLRNCKGLLSVALILTVILWNFWVGPGVIAATAPTIKWDKTNETITADVESAKLIKVLQEISTCTGWYIFVEPGVDQQISVRFSNLSQKEALPKLIGNLSYALVPKTNSPPWLFVFKNAIKNATEYVRPGNSKSARRGIIPNELVVSVKPGQSSNLEALAKSLGATIVSKSDELGLYRLRFSDPDSAKSAMDLLLSSSAVDTVENNQWLSAPADIVPLFYAGPDAMNIPLTPKNTGNDIVIGLVDTAIQADNPILKNFLLQPISVVNSDGSIANYQGPTHATAMAETILKAMTDASGTPVATSVKILPIDVYGLSDSTTTFDVAIGIANAVNEGSKIINLSLGGDSPSQILQNTINKATSYGVIIVAAAGNTPTSQPVYPAALPEVVAVTAGNQNGIAWYANKGDFVDAVAPGTSIIYYNNGSYIVNGTSVSAATFSGWIIKNAEANNISLDTSKQNLLTIYAPKK